MLAGNLDKSASGGARLIALVADSGSAAHPTIVAALKDLRNLKSPDLSDIAHFLCVLHGRYPGLVDHAARKIVDGAAREWILHTGNAFAEERAFLSRLTTAAFAMQSRALEMLASSDRQGCPAGAAIAFAEDWLTIRLLLEAMAERFALKAPPHSFPNSGQNARLTDALIAEGQAQERALFFGADQLLLQQASFWNLLAARSITRSEHL
jgi:hypothetical protein